MRIATLFSGIGAPEQGAKRVYPDHEVIFACEFDKFARQSYEANYDISPEHFHSDVNDLDATQYKGRVDILIGGSPCQAFSLAGLRKGTDDERGKLIYQYIRVVDECRPEVIIYENVKGITNIDNGNTIKDFVQALRDIGYFCHYDVINTKDYGVPQNRERLFLVGFLDHAQYHRFNFSDSVALEKRLKDILEDNVSEEYSLSEKEQSIISTNDGEIRVYSATNKGYEVATVGDSINLSVPSSKTRRGRVGKQVAQCLDTACNQAIVEKDRIRKLTERECLRLQDFPDDFKIVVSSSQLYKQVGNSMSVNILEMIFNQIEKSKSGECRNTLLQFIA